MEYGTGAIMAVPGHDERDFEFARRYRLPIVRVVAPRDPSSRAERGEGTSSRTDLKGTSSRAESEGTSSRAERGTYSADPDLPLEAAYTDNENGVLVHSGQFDGMTVAEGKRAITAWLADRGAGKATINYRLHDWTISRQRYWGPPIPIIYCDQHGAVPVPEKDLPVELPILEDFRPDDSGISPLARHESWYHVPCPVCGKQGRRETDVSDTFLDSAWYHLRYPSTEFDDRPFDPARTRKWLPVDSYIGGNEHAVLHLLYSRFITMVLHELGHVHFDEPYRKFRAHGLIIKDGAKMSKSKGNVVIPDEYIARWGADTFRMYLMFLGPFLEGGDFRDEGISGPRRFLEKVWALVGEAAREAPQPSQGAEARESLRAREAGVAISRQPQGDVSHGVQVKLHQTIKKVTEGMEQLHYNTSIAALMELVNVLRAEGAVDRGAVEKLIVMLAPFVPHFGEESWERLGHDGSIFDARWPEWDEALVVEDQVEVVIQVSGKTRGRVSVPRDAEQGTVVAAAQEDAAVRRFTDGKEVRKVVYVPNRLLNLVVG